MKPQAAPAQLPRGPEYTPLAQLADELGLKVETLRVAARAGKVPGARLYCRRWSVHRPTFTAEWVKASAAGQWRQHLETFAGKPGLGYGGLRRIADSLEP